MNVDCIFCRIVDGAMPCNKVYEDADVLAFLDIGPIVKGHTLVVPKEHFDPLPNVPGSLLSNLMAVVQRIADAQLRGLQADGVNVFQANGAAAGQVVPHVHFHVIPRFNDDGHHWNWQSSTYDGAGEMERYAGRIKAVLQGGAEP